MPAGAVGDDCGMDLGRELRADFIEVQLHHDDIGAGQNQADGIVARDRASAYAEGARQGAAAGEHKDLWGDWPERREKEIICPDEASAQTRPAG